MTKYSINYYETYVGNYEIEADSKEEAEEKLKEMISEGQVDSPEICENSYCEVEEIDDRKEFLVKIVETYERIVPIKAVDRCEACQIAENQVNSGKIDILCDGGSYDYNVEFFANEVKEWIIM